MLRTVLACALIVSASTQALAVNDKWLMAKIDDNMSMMDYARQNDERLSEKAKRVTVDPDFSPSMAEWRYYMPDGKVVSCLRGMQGMTFVYRCRDSERRRLRRPPPAC